MPNDARAFDLQRYLQEVDRWEPALDAFAYREDKTVLLAQPDSPEYGPLAGIPFAVKDVIDVSGQPTRYGSDAFPDAGPAAFDAPVVRALRAAGAIAVGKTRSTEFAFVDPTTTRNPYDPECSPGGSSSGSGAAVGAGVVPFALGTQTAGSLCRPAAYCGACAYKPGLGILPADGMSPLSPSFDAIGVIAGSPYWLTRVYDVLAASFAIPPAMGSGPRNCLKIGLLSVPEQRPGPAMQSAMAATVAALTGAGHEVRTVMSPIEFTDVIRQHRTVMLFEMAAALRPRVSGREDRLQPRFSAALIEGEGITRASHDGALASIKQALVRFWSGLASYDLVLAYPVPSGPPAGLLTTGDQSYLTPWTAMGGPLVSLPAGIDSRGLPLGILFAAAPGQDGFLVREAAGLAPLLPPTPLPSPLPALAQKSAGAP